MSARKKKMEEKTGFTPRKILYLSLAVLMFSAIVSFLLTANTSNKPAAQAVRGLFEGRGRVEDGLLEIEGVEPIEDVPEGEVRYYINKKVVFPNGYEQGDIVLQNPSACGYVLQAAPNRSTRRRCCAPDNTSTATSSAGTSRAAGMTAPIP